MVLNQTEKKKNTNGCCNRLQFGGRRKLELGGRRKLERRSDDSCRGRQDLELQPVEENKSTTEAYFRTLSLGVLFLRIQHLFRESLD